ncbi:single-stranded DNA-binding protein [Wenjunlia tyrosinilytica]|uniref:Single-stranded DNA-binding protein n=1 Tax=Wenjunlia tyrosinilytica TaxID=1544741 RepID=A0A918DRE8_9ACTN|nr:single-stranded DNA-binding protein [Wenjunlia tyrosinilytica]GGO81057.1 single-stranded DNA-binding protein 1 [Wenjunlia tyrosinilytica]
MNETTVTLVGNAATEVKYRETPTGIPVASFRLAVTARRWDRERNGWVDAQTSFYTVWSWRGLAGNVATSVGRGDPLVVQGRIRVREWEKDGQRQTTVEIDAGAVGHDLSRGTSAFRRGARAARPPQSEQSEFGAELEEAAPGVEVVPDVLPEPAGVG